MSVADLEAPPAPLIVVDAPKPSGRMTRTSGMTVNALSLMSSTIVANVLGLAFWTLASHLHDAHQVGRASATVSALILLATIAQLNLPTTFLRFLPAAGAQAARFIARSYGTVIVLGLLAGAVYVFSGLGSGVLMPGWVDRAVLIGSVALAAVFAVQDGVLTALRLTWWVPIENTAFALGKLLLLPALLFLPATLGVVVAWMAPVAIAVLVINVLLFRRVLPGRAQEPGRLPERRTLVSFVAAEYAGTLCATAVMQAMPLLVVWRLGATENAYFTLPWLVWMAMIGLLGSITASFAVEVVSAPERASQMLRKSLLLWGGCVGAIVVGSLAAAPLFLSLSGPGYADHGAGVLRLIGLSAPFIAIVSIYTAFAWIEKHVWRLAVIQACTGLLLVGPAFALMPSLGLAGIGWANLIAQGITAALMLPSLIGRVRRWRRTGSPLNVSTTKGPL